MGNELVSTIDMALANEMDRAAIPVGEDLIAPNLYRVYLSAEQHRQIAPARKPLEEHLCGELRARLGRRRNSALRRIGVANGRGEYRVLGPIEVTVLSDPEQKLRSGEVRVSAAFPRDAPQLQGNVTTPLQGLMTHSPANTVPPPTVKLIGKNRAVAEVPDGSGRTRQVPIDGDEVKIGRGGVNDGVQITVPSDLISRVHLALRLVDHRWQLCDLSSNGTAVKFFFGLFKRPLPPKRWIPAPGGKLRLVLSGSVPITLRLP